LSEEHMLSSLKNFSFFKKTRNPSLYLIRKTKLYNINTWNSEETSLTISK
jgi:hypothetical protein